MVKPLESTNEHRNTGEGHHIKELKWHFGQSEWLPQKYVTIGSHFYVRNEHLRTTENHYKLAR